MMMENRKRGEVEERMDGREWKIWMKMGEMEEME